VNLPDETAVAALAARLHLSPRELLVLAGQLARAPGEPLDAQHLGDAAARVRAAGGVAADAAALLLLGYGSFAQDDIDTALTLAWSGATPPAG
jgi:hypothetical protein